MNEQLFRKICNAYGWYENAFFEPLGNGLINSTWKITNGSNSYVLQAVNHQIFKQPQQMDDNIKAVTAFLAVNHPNYIFPTLTATKAGSTLIKLAGLWFRAFDFINDTTTFTTVDTASQAFEAASQFGKFTALLHNFNTASLHIILPDFHNLSLRYHQFIRALQNGNSKRINESKEAITFLQLQESIVNQWHSFMAHKDAKQRVTHHDTKISNVLFNKQQKAVCIIDIDTLMPGYFISDAGDMLRTYVCPVNEEETDFTKISIRKAFIEAINKGYASEMNDTLTAFEQDHFYFAGECMIYMQALRFLTDYLNNDVYYGCRYEKHNYNRAFNQIVLLQLFMQQ